MAAPEAAGPDARSVVRVVPSLALGFQSFLAAGADLGVVAFDVVQTGET